MTFAHTIRARRRELHLTQVELAGLLDVDKQSVSNWECGRSTPWPKEQTRVLAALGVSLAPPRERIVDRCLKGLEHD